MLNIFYVIGVVTTLAGSGQSGEEDGAGGVASFQNPCDVKVDVRDGSLLVADSFSNKIRKISRGTCIVF